MKWWVLGLVVLWLVSCSVAQEASLSPSDVQAVVGDNLTLTVTASSFQAGRGFQYRIYFDDSVWQMRQVVLGDYLAGCVSLWSGAINGSGVTGMDAVCLDDAPIDTNTVMGTVEFTAVFPGSGSFELLPRMDYFNESTQWFTDIQNTTYSVSETSTTTVDTTLSGGKVVVHLPDKGLEVTTTLGLGMDSQTSPATSGGYVPNYQPLDAVSAVVDGFVGFFVAIGGQAAVIGSVLVLAGMMALIGGVAATAVAALNWKGRKKR